MINERSKLINPELYRQANEEYRQWNALETAARLTHSEPLSTEQLWRRYVNLVEFCWRLHPQQSEWQRTQKLAALEHYYTNLQRLETWRINKAKAATVPLTVV